MTDGQQPPSVPLRTRDIAARVGQSQRTVQMYLRERYGPHAGEWWKFTETEYQSIVEQLLTKDRTRRRGGLRYHRHSK